MNGIPTGAWPAWISDVAFELGWKSSALLAAVGLMVLATRKRPTIAAAVANAGLVALLVLPVTFLVLPPLAVVCLPAVRQVAVEQRLAPPSFPTAEPRPEAPPSDDDFTRHELRAVFPTEVAIASPAPGSTVRGSSLAIEPVVAVAMVYLMVVAVFLTRLGFGLAAVRRLRRQAVAVDESDWLSMLDRWRTRLGIFRKVNLAWSSDVSVPVVVGWRRPMILLPVSAGSLEGAGHRDAILVHELAHIRRGDYAWNLVQRLAVALYWAHPLAWLVARASAGARERACDDLCIHQMGGPAAYRATLLAVAAGLVRRPGPALGLAMARTPRLAGRLKGIDRSRGTSRCVPRSRTRLAIAAAVLVTVSLVGAARLTRAQVQKLADEPAAVAQDPVGGKVFHLRVVSAATGKPVPRANVRVWIAMRNDWRVTDEDGRLDIRYATGPADRHLGVDVWGDGFAMQRQSWGEKFGIPVPDGDTMKLMPGETLGGLVRDEQGRPIAGATVYLWSHNYKKEDPKDLLFDLRAVSGPDGQWKTSGAPETTGELLGFRVDHPDFLSDRDYVADREKPKIADLRSGTAISVMKKGVPVEGRVVDAEGRPVVGALVRSAASVWDLPNGDGLYDVTTDKNGAFRVGQLRSQTYFFIATAAGYAPGEAEVRVRAPMPELEIRLSRPRSLRGRVVDGDGKPLEGVSVNVESWRRLRFLGVYLYTDKEGRFRWDDAPEDSILLNLGKQGYLDIPRGMPAPSHEEAVYTLRRSLVINGSVRDAETRNKILRARVEYAEIDPANGGEPTWTGLPEGAIGIFEGSLNAAFPVTTEAYRIRILAEGFEPFVSRVFRREEVTVSDYDVNLTPLRPGTGPMATALKPDGKPLVGARVYWGILAENNLHVTDGEVRSESFSGREIRTGPDGSFPILPLKQPSVILILGDEYYAYAGGRAVMTDRKLHAKPYARLEGCYLIGSRPMANASVTLRGDAGGSRTTDRCSLFFKQTATTDAEGRFHFDRVVPTPSLRVSGGTDTQGKSRSWSLGTPVRVEPGQTATVQVGGTGMPVIGRVEPPAGWKAPIDFIADFRTSIESNRPSLPFPLEFVRGKTSLNDGRLSDWIASWGDSAEAQDYLARRVFESGGLEPDGTFRFEDLPPGEYRFSIGVSRLQNRGDAGPFARTVRVLTVPQPAGGRTDRPLNLGTFTLRSSVSLKAGDPAPPFKVTLTDGKELSIPADFRGKVLLLDFGTLWDYQSRFQITYMNDIQARFGKNPGFALLSLTFAEDTEDTRKYVADKGETWPQAIVGNLSNPIADAYGIDDENVSAAILIGPDGKILRTRLPFNQIGAAVQEALERD